MNLRALTLAAVLAVSLPVLPRSAPPAAPSEPWTLRYYTLRGAAVDFLVRNPETLTKGFHGRPVVLKNETYRTLSDLEARFSTPFGEGKFGRGSGDGDAFFAAHSRGVIVARAHVGQPFFVGDSHTGAGMYPSPKSSVADLKQILKGDKQWRVAVSHEGRGNGTDIGRVMFWRSSDAASAANLPSPDDTNARQIVKLMRFVAGDRFPFGFFLVHHSATLEGCGQFEVSELALPRYVGVRVAVVENNSGHALSITGFQGVRNGSVALRLAGSDDQGLAGAHGVLGFGPTLTLEAGRRLIVPIRIAFSFGDYRFASPYSPDLAMMEHPPAKGQIQRFLGDFNAKWKKLAFDLSDRPREDADTGKKPTIAYGTLASLAKRPWRDPHVKEDFIYGPSYRITAVNVRSAHVSAVPRKSQSLDYVTSGGYGSCPFVSVWDGDKALWLEYGRVLIGAVGPGAQSAETYDLPAAPSEIAITEKEAEDTHLTKLYLDVDGRRIWPLESGVATVYEGERRSFRFQVPEELRNRPARLHLSGYYIRRPRISLQPA